MKRVRETLPSLCPHQCLSPPQKRKVFFGSERDYFAAYGLVYLVDEPHAGKLARVVLAGLTSKRKSRTNATSFRNRRRSPSVVGTFAMVEERIGFIP